MNDNHSDTDIDLSALEEAADWFDRRDELSEAEQQLFAAWLSASGARARAYAAMRHTMLDPALLAASRQIDHELENQVEKESRVPAQGTFLRLRGFLSSRKELGGAALLAAALIVAAIFVPLISVRPPERERMQMREFATASRQPADWRLTDNSHLYLDADSKVAVTYRPKARDFALERGEAIFEVAKDKARPFHVTAHAVTVTAVGTLFGVDLINDAIAVRVYHGVVTVAGGGAPPVSLRQGDWLTIDPRLGARSGRFDSQTYQNWRTDWLEADNMPLSYVVAKLNRYSDTSIVIGDDALGAVMLTGRFRLSDTGATLKLISALLNLRAVQRGDHFYLTARRS
jgi:transmembrane sensor